MTKKDFKGLVFIASIHRGLRTIYCGSIEHMITEVFGYTLECGRSWNHKINRYPKTARGLVNALNKSAEECRRYSDWYEVSSYEEFINNGGTLDESRSGSVLTSTLCYRLDGQSLITL